jgi:hypothetical protein
VRLISGIVANCRGCFDGTLFGRRTSWLNNGGLWCDRQVVGGRWMRVGVGG